ncbi:protein of unknown function [Gracilibacillus ureilyticus]|uniref:Carbohydrate-binding domain-containing protein n=1 Tax=Gracilibacillus ureilyticus TaxID=531814 RepID=A0A1H9QP28_9BACI|nr:carbohydrate-binding domain-containing protein [Gracilibacillus ureilyticus]SER62170.1 protein of unknown function [Gracilibacillus ureilyticus]
MLNQKLKIIFPFLSLIIVSMIILNGCSNKAAEEINVVNSIVSYDGDDTYTDWEEDEATYINLDENDITVEDNNSILVNDNQIEIHTSGTYVLEGTLTDGQVVVDAEDDGTVRLILNGVTMESSTSSPIYVKQAEKTVISIEEGTENYLSDAAEYIYSSDETEEHSAAIYSKDDLTINGAGNLTVEGNFNDGITGRDVLKIVGGTINITAKDDGIVGRDIFALKDADITITAQGDGVKSSNDSDADKGNVVLENGSLTIDAAGDGIQSENTVTVVEGEYNITAGRGSPETIEVQETMGGGFGGVRRGDFSAEDGEIPEEFQDGERPTPPAGEGMIPPEGMEAGEVPEAFAEGVPPTGTSGEEQSSTEQTEGDISTSTDSTDEGTTETEETPSTKGIKAVNELTVLGGTISIDSYDDSVHSDLDVIIEGGTMEASTGDDGIHADGNVTVAGGNIAITKSLEGIEGTDISVTDGKVYVTAEDDGFNVSGGSDGLEMGQMDMDATNSTTAELESTTEESGQLLIEGGYIYVNANGDGLDSNTSATMTGGTVLVYGPTNSGNGALDYNQSFDITGGTLIAAGSSGMAQGVSDTSSQATVMMTFSEMQEAATSVSITDSNGNEVAAIAPEKEFQMLLISSPDLEQGETYTVSTGSVFTGESTDGLYIDANPEGGTDIVEFTAENVMTYVNESGVTEQSGGMQGGFGRGMARPGE